MGNHYTTNPAADLGTIDYSVSLELQRKLVDKVRRGELGDVLLFLDHPSVFTVGRGKKPENYSGVEVIETERGGDVTYHGPGQLVIYPIIDLEKNEIDGVRKFVHLIENIVITSVGKLGFEGKVGDEPGIWVDGKKVASIGLAIRDKISFHGVAINISNEVIAGFNRISPCGLDPRTIGYIKVEREALIRQVRDTFDREVHPFERVNAEYFNNI